MRIPYRTTGRGGADRARLPAVAAAAAVLTLGSGIVSAQVMDPLRGYNLNGDAIGGAQQRAPRGRDVPVEPDEQAQRPAYASTGRMRRVAEERGLRLTSMPHRRGRAFFATAEDQNGHRIQLMFNPYNGFIVGQRDMGAPVPPTAIAKAPAAKPAEQTAAAARPASPAEASPAPSDAELAVAKEAADKAVAAEAEAKRAADTAVAEARRATAKLAEIETAARRAAEAKAQEARRQEQVAAEQRRQEAKAAELKRRALATAEAKLAQAKAVQARAAAEAARAEAEAAAARAAFEPPAELSRTAEKPTEMAPAAKADSLPPAQPTKMEAKKAEPAQMNAAKADAAGNAASEPEVKRPAPEDAPHDQAKDGDDKPDASKIAEPAPAPRDTKADAAEGAAAETSRVAKSVDKAPEAPSDGKAAAGPQQADASEPAKNDSFKNEPAKANGIDGGPGSTKDSPPAPYSAPTPVDGNALAGH